MEELERGESETWDFTAIQLGYGTCRSGRPVISVAGTHYEAETLGLGVLLLMKNELRFEHTSDPASEVHGNEGRARSMMFGAHLTHF